MNKALMNQTSHSYISAAIAEAHTAMQRDEVPVGAVIVHNNQVISACGNEMVKRQDPTAHAEILAIREAAQKLGAIRLSTCDLYVTLEPCPMCAHAMCLARIRRLYFGAFDPKGGGVDHGPKIFDHETCHHKIEVMGGICEQECAKLLQAFFDARR